MRLFSGKVAPIATEVVRALSASKDIEAESSREVTSDVEAVLNQYLATEREVGERTKDILDRTGQKATEFNRVRQLVATEKGIKVGDETLDYLLDQVVAMFHYSANVDEIFAEDVELRRKMAPIFKKHMAVDSTIDSDIRAQLKHMKEGSREWDIEYARVAEQVKRKRGV